ncbi:pseudouridine synthase, partial [Pseudoalteromonas sp. S327]
WPGVPTVSQRMVIPTTWLSSTIIEGRNMLDRRMTAPVWHPTFRLIRYSIGTTSLDGINSAQYSVIKGEVNA